MSKPNHHKKVEEIANYIMRNFVNHDPLGRRENEIKEAMSPLVRVIKEQQKEIEKLEKIKKISNAEELTLADFAKAVLSIIEGREMPTRKERT